MTQLFQTYVQRLETYGDSIDSMALRERVMFFGAVALVLMTLLQVFLLNPLLSRRTQLSSQIAQQDDETKAIQAQIQSLVRPDMPDQDALNRDKLKSLREQMSQLDRELEQQQRQFVAPAKMAAMLQDMIGKNRKLQLVSLRNLPGGSVSESGAGGPASAAAGGARAGGGREIFRHTIELSVRGSYSDLLDYLTALEHLPVHLFWDGFELTAQYPQSVLKLTIYTLSPEKSWLTV
jgi:MSHA biogenesis protein MshJ